jgi:hypothetical protein
MLRQKELCPAPQNCPDVLTVEPDAGPSAMPCELCPQLALQRYLASPGGLLVQIVIDLDFALQAGVTLRLADIPYPEFLLLRQLAEERDRYQAEEIRKKAKR